MCQNLMDFMKSQRDFFNNEINIILDDFTSLFELRNIEVCVIYHLLVLWDPYYISDVTHNVIWSIYSGKLIGKI